MAVTRADDFIRRFGYQSHIVYLWLPMITWDNGQVVWVQPEDIKVDDD